jgi:uncharacterized protein YjbI with pentapeptide repeats
MAPAEARPGTSLVDDCSRCVGLCCVLLAFARSTDFAMDKAAGVACPNLDTAHRCSIHDSLADRGFRGCQSYSCFGAGPRVTQAFEGRQADPDAAGQMAASFHVVRSLHELLWYLRACLAEQVGADLTRSLTGLLGETEEMASCSPDDLLHADVAGHRDRVNAALLRASEHLRGPHLGRDLRGADLIGARLAGASLRRASLRGALLMGADLRGADLRQSDLTGADLRDADLSGADLRGALFLTPAQLHPTRGSAQTRLPRGVHPPRSW